VSHWIGGGDWRGQGFFRAPTEQQESGDRPRLRRDRGQDEDKFYDMRGTLDHLRFEVVRCSATASTTPVEGTERSSAGDDLHPPQQKAVVQSPV
jgi:hypothetical protein